MAAAKVVPKMPLCTSLDLGAGHCNEANFAGYATLLVPTPDNYSEAGEILRASIPRLPSSNLAVPWRTISRGNIKFRI